MAREKGTVVQVISMADWGQIKRDVNGQIIEFSEVVDVPLMSVQPGQRVSFDISGGYAVDVRLE